MTAAVAVITTVGAGVLIGHTALAFLMPLTFLALLYSYRRHHNRLPIGVGVAVMAIGYGHIVGGTPEWTLYIVLALSFLAATLDWRATRACAYTPPVAVTREQQLTAATGSS